MIDNLWEGIYGHFRDVPAKGGGHQGSEWLEKSIARAKEQLAQLAQSGSVPASPAYDASLLPMLAATVGAGLGGKRPLRVVDFGGGLGSAYLPCRAALAHEIRLDFHIVEMPEMVEAGKELFADNDEVTFHSELPEVAARVDIVHLGSSLHYVEDWQGLLGRLAAFDPDHFLFTDLAAGDNPTFATAQVYYDSRIPVWMFNLSEIVDRMAGLGWRPLFKATFRASLFGSHVAELPQKNFPKEYRLGNSCHLLLGRR